MIIIKIIMIIIVRCENDKIQFAGGKLRHVKHTEKESLQTKIFQIMF